MEFHIGVAFFEAADELLIGDGFSAGVADSFHPAGNSALGGEKEGVVEVAYFDHFVGDGSFSYFHFAFK